MCAVLLYTFLNKPFHTIPKTDKKDKKTDNNMVKQVTTGETGRNKYKQIETV